MLQFYIVIVYSIHGKGILDIDLQKEKKRKVVFAFFKGQKDLHEFVYFLPIELSVFMK